jgi:hypothetical protein
MISLTGRSPNLACREFVALVLSLIAIGMLDGCLEAKGRDVTVMSCVVVVLVLVLVLVGVGVGVGVESESVARGGSARLELAKSKSTGHGHVFADSVPFPPCKVYVQKGLFDDKIPHSPSRT